MNAWDLGQSSEKLKAVKAELLTQVEDIDKELARRDGLDAAHRLAEELHSVECHTNHTDGCGWFYEFSKGEANWSGWAHTRFLTRARKLLEAFDNNPEAVLKVVKLLRIS